MKNIILISSLIFSSISQASTSIELTVESKPPVSVTATIIANAIYEIDLFGKVIIFEPSVKFSGPIEIVEETISTLTFAATFATAEKLCTHFGYKSIGKGFNQVERVPSPDSRQVRAVDDGSWSLDSGYPSIKSIICRK